MVTEEAIREIDNRIHDVLCRLGWKGPAGIAHASARRARVEQNPAEYSFQVEEGYEEGLTYFPTALEMLCDVHPEYAMIIDCACRFVMVWDDRLRADGLLNSAVLGLTTVFDIWRHRFVPSAVTFDDGGKLVYRFADVPAPPIDVLFESLMETRIAVDGKSVFESLLSDWSEDTNDPNGSAAFLDFALRVRCSPGPLELYRSPKVLAYVFDTERLRRHSAVAEPVSEALASSSYRKALSTLF